jgi:hypothetical protein
MMPRPTVHPTLARLKESVGNSASTVQLKGFVGPSPEGIVCLFSDLSLDSTCIDIPEKAVLHFEEDSESGQTTLFVDPSATLEIVAVETLPALAFKKKDDKDSDSDLAITNCVADKIRKCMRDRLEDGRPLDAAIGACSQLAGFYEALCKAGEITLPSTAGQVSA